VLDQNLAFRAVNQSIGRAIRHANDWASIILIDRRYTLASNQKKLPGWLGEEVKNVETSFAELMKELVPFCKKRKIV
jgi:chromosome transmission fidelity protein 1